MNAIWKGSISFGLVSIPISLYPATRREERIQIGMHKAGGFTGRDFIFAAKIDELG